MAHDFPLESLVCYTFCSSWRWKGAVLCQTKLPGDSRTDDFARENIWKRESAIAKSGCSYVGDADTLVVSEKIICITGEQKGYIKYYGNSDRTFSKAVFSVDFALLSDR